MLISSQADTFTFGRGAGIIFPLLCVSSCSCPLLRLLARRLPLFCLSACYQSPSLSPLTFPPLCDAMPVFHFVPASCSILINKQMTSPVCGGFFLFVWMSNEPHLWIFLPTAGSLWVLLSPSPACGPQVYIHLVIFKYSSALISSWLFCFVSLFQTFVSKPVAAGRPVSTVNICVCVRSFAFMRKQNVLCNTTYSRWNGDLFPLALYDHPHTLVTSLSCGFFFMWVDNKESIALSKVLLCAASVACFQPVIMMPCGLVSGYDSDKRCLTKVSSLLVCWPLVLMGFQ